MGNKGTLMSICIVVFWVHLHLRCILVTQFVPDKKRARGKSKWVPNVTCLFLDRMQSIDRKTICTVLLYHLKGCSLFKQELFHGNVLLKMNTNKCYRRPWKLGGIQRFLYYWFNGLLYILKLLSHWLSG